MSEQTGSSIAPQQSDSLFFTIDRTSSYGNDDEPPHGRAERDQIVTWGYYTFRSVAEARKRYPDREFERSDHGIRSYRGVETVWSIRFSDLADLMAFCDDVGRVVIERNWQNHEIRHINIYDDYRE